MATTVHHVNGGFYDAAGVFKLTGYSAARASDPEDTEATTPEQAIEAVFANLATQTLMPSLASFAHALGDGTCELFGNFVEVSGGFSIVTDDAALIARFNAAVKANVSTTRYRGAKLDMERRDEAKREGVRRPVLEGAGL